MRQGSCRQFLLRQREAYPDTHPFPKGSTLLGDFWDCHCLVVVFPEPCNSNLLQSGHTPIIHDKTSQPDTVKTGHIPILGNAHCLDM